jgi:hypothetical protein
MQPGDTENLISVLLCRENPSAVRVRPSRGDGGIDVLVETAQGWVVHQIKYFFANLTDSQKAQIEESFKRVRAYAGSKGALVAAWYLWLPLDPTNENRGWFGELTAAAGYPCEWHGHTHCEGLAAKYPEVIDYYVNNGGARLQAIVEHFISVIGLRQGTASPPAGQLQPGDLEVDLGRLHAALNAQDPHYRYDFAVHGESPPLPPPEPMLVAALIRQQGDAWVTFKVYARMREAVHERPVPITLQIKAPPDSETARKLEDFDTYGTPTSISNGGEVAVRGSIDLPGGLATSLDSGTVHLGPSWSDDAVPYDLRLQVLDETGACLASVIFRMAPVTVGPSRQGVRAVGTEQHGALNIEITTNLVTQKVNVALRVNDLTGLRPVEVLPGLRAAVALGPPNRLRFAAPYGPADHPAMPIPTDARIEMGGALRVIEALATIQDYTTEQLSIPDLTQMSGDEGVELVHIARLLRLGSYEATWTRLAEAVPSDTLDPQADLDTASPVIAIRPLIAKIGDTEVMLGYRRARLASARIGALTPRPDGTILVELVPGDDDTAIIEHITSTD